MVGPNNGEYPGAWTDRLSTDHAGSLTLNATRQVQGSASRRQESSVLKKIDMPAVFVDMLVTIPNANQVYRFRYGYEQPMFELRRESVLGKCISAGGSLVAKTARRNVVRC